MLRSTRPVTRSRAARRLRARMRVRVGPRCADADAGRSRGMRRRTQHHVTPAARSPRSSTPGERVRADLNIRQRWPRQRRRPDRARLVRRLRERRGESRSMLDPSRPQEKLIEAVPRPPVTFAVVLFNCRPLRSRMCSRLSRHPRSLVPGSGGGQRVGDVFVRAGQPAASSRTSRKRGPGSYLLQHSRRASVQCDRGYNSRHRAILSCAPLYECSTLTTDVQHLGRGSTRPLVRAPRQRHGER